ncbi:uncharacterized protein LOC118694261 isoform X2 [Molothrus ater]|uniref:uncharacterized protein LOC118694261 isoform X2 n=1 Tax=Molothrus ater TaxID=84834 RepID=UPI00174CD6C4|nr:uncharacterized protein LOC118694261 isoform X2 [Molothrus ater]
MNEPRSPLLRARSYKSPARCGQRSTDTGAGPAGSRGAPARPGSRGARRRHRPPHGGRPPPAFPLQPSFSSRVLKNILDS